MEFDEWKFGSVDDFFDKFMIRFGVAGKFSSLESRTFRSRSWTFYWLHH